MTRDKVSMTAPAPAMLPPAVGPPAIPFQAPRRRGERCVLEAFLAVDNGQPLDLVLRNFARLSPATYY